MKNPPLTRVRQLGPNMTEAEHGELTVLYSYETPVAVFVPGAGYLRTDHFFSRTTSKHIGKWAGPNARKVPQPVIEHLAVHADPQDAAVAGAIARKNPRKRWVFDRTEVGTWVDGAYGPEHRRDKLVELLNMVFPVAQGADLDAIPELIESLEQEPPDDYGDEDDSIQVLANYTAPGLVWLEDAGDLILTTEDQAE